MTPAESAQTAQTAEPVESAPPSEQSAPSAQSGTRGYRQPRVDVAALTATLDGPYAEVRNAVRAGLAAHADVVHEAYETPRDDFRERVLELVREFAADGQTALGLPAAYGGADDVGAAVAAFETVAFGDLSVLVKIGVQFGLFGGAVHQLGTRSHHETYLADIASGRLLGCFAMTETGHGSNVQALGTTATYVPETDEWEIHTPDAASRKDYIGNAARHGQMAVVFAQLVIGEESEGVHAFLVPIRDGDQPCPGVTITDCGHKMGLQGVDNGRLSFDRVRIPRTNLLNQFAAVDENGIYSSSIASRNARFFTMLGTLIQGRVCVGGAGISAAKVALTLAVRYADRRRQFNATSDESEELLLDYGMHQRRLLPLVAKTYALHFAQQVLAGQLQQVLGGTGAAGEEGAPGDRERRALESRAAGTKALGSWLATEAIQECREACGGAGYLSANRFDRLKADTDVFTTFEGDNHVLLQLVAKGLLTDYSSDFADLDQLGMVRFVASLAVETVIERTSVHKLFERIKDALPGGDEWDAEAGLLDPNYHLTMFEFREEHQLAGVARRLKRGIDSGMNPGEVFSRVQSHVIAAARSHVDRLVLQAFVDAYQSMPVESAGPDGEPGNRAVLGMLCDLYALSAIEADRGWFSEHGRLSTQRSKAITREIDALCRKLRPLAVDLVDGFGVPEELLAVEMLAE